MRRKVYFLMALAVNILLSVFISKIIHNVDLDENADDSSGYSSWILRCIINYQINLIIPLELQVFLVYQQRTVIS